MKSPHRPGKYQENLERFKKVVRFEPVDRTPIAFAGLAFIARYMGIKMADLAPDPKLQRAAQFDALERLNGVDGLNGPLTGAPFDVVLGGLWMSKVLMPGRELGEDVIWQVAEKELMTLDDYDYIIEHGWNKFKSHFWPRLWEDRNSYTKFMISTVLNTPLTLRKYKRAGYVPLCGAAGTIPYEPLCGGRSMSKFVFDLYRHPDKVEQVMDVMLPDMTKELILGGRMSGGLGVWIGGWRSASSVLGPDQWERFVFPYMKKMAEAVVEAGMVPILHLDQDWTRDLERFLEFPAKACIMNLDGMTDARKAKEVLDGHMAVMGDVPASILTTGTPEDVREYVRELIEIFGQEGLILCTGCDAPDSAKPENIEAMITAGIEFGKFD